MTIKVKMAIGYESDGKRDEHTSYGVGVSKKSAKTDAYRKGMTALKTICKPERYKVIYAVPTAYHIMEEPGDGERDEA